MQTVPPLAPELKVGSQARRENAGGDQTLYACLDGHKTCRQDKVSKKARRWWQSREEDGEKEGEKLEEERKELSSKVGLWGKGKAAGRKRQNAMERRFI